MRISRINGNAAAAAVGAALLCASAPVHAVELNYSVGLGPGSTVTQNVTEYAEKVAKWSDGDLTIRVFPLSLVQLPEMGPGIRDGLTDLGFMAAPYYPSEFAHTNFLAEQTMALHMLDVPAGKEGWAFAGAMSEFILQDCEDCLEEYRAQNHTYLGHMGTSPYVMICGSEPITSAADLQGKRLRTGSAVYDRFAAHFQATAIKIPASESYEAMSQGVLDCVLASAGDLTNYRLMEVAKSVTVGAPGNVYGGTVAGNMNRPKWQSLTEEQRKTLLRATAWLAARMTWSYRDLQTVDLASAEEKGISVVEIDDAFKEEVRDFVAADQELVADLFSTNYQIEDAQQMQERFRPYLKRWAGLVADIETSDELADLYWSEIYSKLDPAVYAMD